MHQLCPKSSSTGVEAALHSFYFCHLYPSIPPHPPPTLLTEIILVCHRSETFARPNIVSPDSLEQAGGTETEGTWVFSSNLSDEERKKIEVMVGLSTSTSDDVITEPVQDSTDAMAAGGWVFSSDLSDEEKKKIQAMIGQAQ